MSKVDTRLNNGELRALLAAIDCFTNDEHHLDGPVLWWKKEPHERATLNALREFLFFYFWRRRQILREALSSSGSSTESSSTEEGSS